MTSPSRWVRGSRYTSNLSDWQYYQHKNEDRVLLGKHGHVTITGYCGTQLLPQTINDFFTKMLHLQPLLVAQQCTAGVDTLKLFTYLRTLKAGKAQGMKTTRDIDIAALGCFTVLLYRDSQCRNVLNCSPDQTMRIPLHIDCTTFCSLGISDVKTMRGFFLSVFVLSHRLFLDPFRRT
ncbi:hypothetical protein J6590_013568 [Homalodisca vitripennis]|nr:hypothetical protein J6590_013568 [Homalodisca vitripennis]